MIPARFSCAALGDNMVRQTFLSDDGIGVNVRRLLLFAGAELWTTVKRPWRVLRILQPGRLRKYLRYSRARWAATVAWVPTSRDSGLAGRAIASYEEYVRLQKSKLEHLDLRRHEARFRAVLRERLKQTGLTARGKKALCLGARLGAEVAAFRDCGCFAVGVDLCPGENNPFVLYGDFHGLEFPDASVDLVYTNSLDHAWDLERILSEVRRVLSPDGLFVVEADPGESESDAGPDLWQTLAWQRVDDLAAEIERLGWTLVSRGGFEYPRNGEQLVFRSRE